MGATRERNWYTSFMRAPSPTMLCSRLISVFSRRFSCSSHCSRRALFEDLARDGTAYPHRLRCMRQTMARKNRGETFAAVAIQQNGAAISRSDFKNQIQNLRLQLLQITDSVHQAADLEQRIEISCHP